MKKHLLKSLLVGLMTLAATSAWAADLTITPSETTVIWASGESENTTNGDQNFYDASATEWLCTQANISGGKLNNQNVKYGGSYVVITKFDCSTQLSGMNIQKATLSFNSVCTVSGKNSNVIVSSIGTDWSASTVTWNSMDRSATKLSADNGQNVGTSQKTLSEDVTSLLKDDEDKVVAFAIHTYTAREQKISGITLTIEAVDASSSANVTLTYVDGGGNELKSETEVATTGASYVLTEAQKAAFFVDGVKYFYVSDNAADVTVAADGSSVITVTCREADMYGYTLNSNLGVVTTGTGYEGETVAVGYPRYALADNVFYEAPKTNDSKKQYRIDIALTADNATAEIAYSAKEGVNAVFFTEAENIEGVTETTAGNIPIRASNAKGATTEEAVTITTLAPGKYKFHVGVFTTKSSYNGLGVNIGIGGETFAAGCTAVNMSEAASEEYTLNVATDIVFLGLNGDAQFDYIWVEKTGDVEVVPVENKTIGLVPGPWDADNATFAAYAWNDEGNAWFPFVEVSGAYATQIPDSYTGIILTRINPEGTDADPWKNVWNQTDDIDFTAIADQTVFTITGWGEGEGAKSTYTTTSVPTDLSELKAALEAAITEATGLNAYANDATLASAISAAQAALASEETTAEQFVAAATALKIAATNAAKTVLTSAVELAGIMGIDTAAAQAVLDNEDATVEELKAALTTLLTNAKSGASIYLTTAQGFFDTFDKTAAANLAPYFAAVQEALAGTDVSAMMAAAKALIEQAKTEAAGPLEKVAEYLGSIENETIATDLAAIKTAVEGGDLKNIIIAVNQLKTDLPDAINTYISAFEYASATYKDDGKTNGIEAVETAISDVKAALANEESTFLEKGAAIYKLIKAIKTFREANSTYTVAGTKDLTGTEEAWQVVADNNMTLTDGLYTWTAENVTVTADAQPEFKVVITDIDDNQTWIPASDEEGDHNWVITPDVVGGEGTYNITITFNAATQEIGVTGENTKPAQIIPNGTYYVLNAAYDEPQLLMAAGHNWGTKGIVNEKGLDFTFTYNESNNTYDIDSRVSNGGNNHFLSSGLWMDGPSYGWTIEGEFVYTISGTFDGVKKYIAVDENNELILTEDGTADNAQWAFLMKDYWENDVVKAEGLEAMKAATETAPVDATFLIKSPDFNRNDLRNAEVWTMEASNKNLAGGGEGGNGCAESYHSTFTLSQLLADAPAGVYSLTAQGFYRQDGSDNDNLPYFYANDEKQTFPLRTGTENGMDTAGDSFAQGNYTIEPIYVEVTEAGQLTVGAKLETNTSLWCIWDNFQLKYYGPDANIDNLKNAALFAQVDELKEQLKQIVESGEIEVEAATTNLTNLLNNVDDLNPTSSAELAEIAIAMLKGGIEIAEGYIKAKNVLPQMKQLTESTNFYTQEAYEAYYGQWYQKYEAGELTPDEANALQDPFVVTGWRANNTVDDLLMSTWDVEPMNWAQYYINTWSVEGASDGTQFEVPFFEYWTGDANSLGEKTLTGTIEGLEAGTYGVSAWVRVRGKNDFTRPAYGITMQVNEGTAIDAASTTEVSGTNFYVGQLNAIGEVGEDGKLVLKFNVAADNNISWLSFKNVKFNKIQTFTAKFENPEDTWEKVYAYTWTGGEYDKVEQLGAWPGTEITATVDENGIYTATIAAQEAPANIIFSNGLEGDALVQTEDFVFEDGKTYQYILPATDIVVTPETGADIYAAVEAEKATVRKVGSISIVLAQDGSYTVSAPLVAYKNLEIQANGATIDANELTGNFIEMATTDNPAVTVPVEFVSIHNATVKGLKKPLFYSSQKGYLIEWLTIDNSIVEVAADVTSIDFTKGSAVRNFNIENSTVYAPVATTKSFFSSQAGQKLTELDAEGIQSFIIKNATMYNLATGKNFFTHRQNNQKWLTYVAENNIFVNCGKKGQAIKGMNGGGSSTNPTWTISGNVFNFEVDGVMTDTSAAEETGDAEEPIQNSYALVMTFVDPAGGDFNADFTAAEDATIPTEKIGDPRWTLNYKAPEVETTYYLVGSFNDWTASDTYKLTLNENADEGIVEYMLTLDIPANSSMKVQDNLGNWYPGDGRPNFEVNDEGNFTVYFRPNADGDEFWFEGYIYCKYNGLPTGINSILAEAVENGKVYNLQGQKVQKAQKGLYIVNGKKMVVK